MATPANASPEKVHRVDFPPVELRLGVPFWVLAQAYARWHDEHLFAQIFYEQPDMSLEQFLDWCYLPTVEPVGCWTGDLLVGIGWIRSAWRMDDGQVVSEVGAAFFRHVPLSIWHRALDLFLNHAFLERDFVEIYGLSSKMNPAALPILKYCGMQPAERLPWEQRMADDTMIFSLKRADWKGLV